jgi:hypothetical protein
MIKPSLVARLKVAVRTLCDYHRCSLTPIIVDPLSDVVQPVLAEVAEDWTRSARGEQECVGLAHPATSTGDDDHFAFDAWHVIQPT